MSSEKICSAFEEVHSILQSTFINSVNSCVNNFTLGSTVINVFHSSNVINLLPLQLNFPVLGQPKTPLYFAVSACFWLPEVFVPAVHCETSSASSPSLASAVIIKPLMI